jgi:hypothetical protein
MMSEYRVKLKIYFWTTEFKKERFNAPNTDTTKRINADEIPARTRLNFIKFTISYSLAAVKKALSRLAEIKMLAKFDALIKSKKSPRIDGETILVNTNNASIGIAWAATVPVITVATLRQNWGIPKRIESHVENRVIEQT